MRKSSSLVGVAYILLACGGDAFAGGRDAQIGEPMDLPKRRPGLWRISTLSSETGLQTHEACVAATDSVIGDAFAGCAPPHVTRVEDQIVATIDCDAGREVTSLLFTGDFRNWYRAQARMTSGARHSGFTIDAKFMSEQCGAPQRR
jgi:hypothetical protein